MHSNFIKQSVAITLALVTHCQAYTYWVDASCSSRPNWQAYMNEAFDMTTNSAARLQRTSDKDYGAVFKRIFKVDKTDGALFQKVGSPNSPGDTAINLVLGIIGDINPTNWQQVNGKQGRLDSDVRFYCDNDARWQPSPKNPQVSFDTTNMMAIRSAASCQASATTFGVTYRARLNIPQKFPTQNINRATVTLCDFAFTIPGTQKLPSLLSDIEPNKDLSELSSIEDLSYLLSMTIVHEWMHTSHYLLEDLRPAYGWPNIMAKNAADSLNNSDNYSFLGLWAMLANRSLNGKGGYTLPRLGNGVSVQSQQAEADAVAGKIKLYHTITKRGLRTVERYFKG